MRPGPAFPGGSPSIIVRTAAAYRLPFSKDPLLDKTSATLGSAGTSRRFNVKRSSRVPGGSSDAAPDGAKAGAAEPSISSPNMIFREIVQGLYKGSYVPGQRLVEADLTAKWSVSRRHGPGSVEPPFG